MKIRKQLKVKPYIITCSILLVIIAFYFVVRFYDSIPEEQISPFVGSYVLGSQVDEDCIYVCIGDKNSEGNYVCVLYKQGDEEYVIDGIAQIHESTVTAFSNDDELTIDAKNDDYSATYGGTSYPIEKISESPMFASNEKAVGIFNQYYE